MSNNPLSLVETYMEQIPVDVYGLIREIGLGLSFQVMDDNISGWIERGADNQYTVAVNQSHASVRRRFTAAHELGHYIYHRDLLGRGVGDTRAYRMNGTPLENVAIRPVHERQANSFAANLLMPKSALLEQISRGLRSTEGLANLFDVSQEAMRIRLGRPKIELT